MPVTAMHTPAAGFTLIEVLVTLVVIAVASLGVDLLLLDGLRSDRAALQRAVAVTLAADLADCVRANPTGATDYTLAVGATVPAPAQACQLADACDASAMAAVDLHRWQQAVRGALPGATTSVEVTAIAGSSANQYAVTLAWIAPGSDLPVTYSLQVVA